LSILASIGISRDSPEQGLSQAEIAAADRVFQAALDQRPLKTDEGKARGAEV
jgi:hypothetical protein